MTHDNARGLSRRDALKLLGAAAGASVLANLPTRWSTPELTAGVLPAHAQTSVVFVGCPGLGLVASTDFGPGSDLDITLLTPGGFLVKAKPPFGANQGLTDPLTGAFHSGDLTSGGLERITVPTGNLTDGSWIITVQHVGGALTPSNISIQAGSCVIGLDPNLGPGGVGTQITRTIGVQGCQVVLCGGAFF